MVFPNAQATTYNDQVVRQFAIMTVVWGVVGMLVGVIIAAQLAWPELNFGIPWLSYGRLRPLHTNAVIFAFGGCGLFASSYYVVQRTCHVRLFSDKLASFTFWGWQLVILAAAISLPLGYTQGKEYAELEWPIDILITVVWVSYAVVFFGTVGTRKVRHSYVATGFFGAFIIAVALLHLVNSAAIPAGFMKSYSAYAGVQDAMVQWWYGHNAVGFFLTAGFLGMMYYFIPKQAERPVYSYRLSIVHFWALIFTYMWAGPHHLHYTALPDWTQSVGMVEIVPLFFQKSTTEPVKGLQPYTALQLAGRDIYTREGCYNCHSQMIRPFRAETLRYGHYSVAGEFVYDHPFQWGSKRTGPDLHRVGGKYSDQWHRDHLNNPRDLVPESNMPAYPWLLKNAVDADTMPAHMKALRTVGVPYTDEQISKSVAELQGKTEIDAVIAYLQVLGTLVK